MEDITGAIKADLLGAAACVCGWVVVVASAMAGSDVVSAVERSPIVPKKKRERAQSRRYAKRAVAVS